MNPQAKLSVCIFSDANFLALNILENLLSRNCFINIITKDVNNWRDKTMHLSIKSKFNILDIKNFAFDNHYDYAIFCGGFVNSTEAYVEYTGFISLPNINAAKTVVIFPFDVFDRDQVDRIKISNNTAILFLGDLLGPRIDLDSDLLIARSLSEMLWKRKLTLAVGETFYPIFIADAVRLIIKWLFSFGPYGKVVFVLGSQVSGDTFWSDNQKLIGKLEPKYDTGKSARIIPKGFETEVVNSNLGFSLAETYNWLKNNLTSRPTLSEKKNETKKIVVKKKKPAFPKIKTALSIFGIVFLFPFITLFISLLVSFVAYKSFVSGRDSAAQNSFYLARTFAVISEKGSDILSFIPGVGLIYKEAKFAATFAKQSDAVGIDVIPIVRNSTQLFENVLGNQVYDSINQSAKIETEMALLYNDVLFTKTITKSASEKNVVLAKKILTKIDFERFIKLISEGRILAGNLPELLGQDKSKTYLLLFENNMELRPTGGFIGSFGLVTFDAGRLSDLTVNDVYSADGQLNGHVEPPLPIKNYLGEANWWLRDSNWDPDFPTSAKRAEWFLDKEISKQVDGVVAVDLFPIKEILKYTGPVFLSDYGLDITSENLYEKTQAEVESNFFPGTHKKASFLTALSRNLLTEVIKLKTSQKLNILKTLYNSLDGRHLQIYLHDNVPQEAFSALGWDGAIVIPTCGTSCYSDLVGTVEANVGTNKANYFIQRSINLDISMGVSKIDHKLTVTLKNPANPALGPSGRYKTYMRVLMPIDASLNSVVSYNGDSQERLPPELTEVKGHKEVGVLVELLAGDTKKIEFSWISGFGGSPPFMNYGLYIRKQAGTEGDPININIEEGGTKLNPDPRFALTKVGAYGYNTTLARDLFLRFSW